MGTLATMKRRGIAVIALVVAPWLVGCGGGGYGGSKGPTPAPVTTSGTVTVYPATASVPLGGSINFAANLPSQPTASFTWAISGGSTNGSISSSGVYTAPTSSVPSPATVTVTATATSGNFTGTSTVTIAAAQGVTLNPSALVVPAGTTTHIAATSGGNPATVTQWQVTGPQGADVGTIDASGNYTAPLAPPPGGTVTVTAHTASSTGTAVVTVAYSNNSLSGPYAFSYAAQSGAGLLTVVGSFTASAGTISAGLEDAQNQGNQSAAATAFTGTYSVGLDGRGTVKLTNETWQIVLTQNPSTAPGGQPVQTALLVRFDNSASGSGTMNHQDSTAVNSPMPAGPFVFSVSGATQNTVYNAAGAVTSGGLLGSQGTFSCTSPSCVWDVTSGSILVPGDTSLTGTFKTDLNNPNSGRGTMTLLSSNTTLPTNGRNPTYVFYVVDATHLKVMENDGIVVASGDIFSGVKGPFSNTLLNNGKYAFTAGGASFPAAGGNPLVQGGVFATNGNGGVVGGALDVNGSVANIFLNYPLAATTYSVDANSGRITLALTATQGSKSLKYNYAGYKTSSGSVILIEIDQNLITEVSGMAFPQTATPALAGNYAANFSGITNTSGGSAEEDVTGQFIVTNSAISSGALDSNLGGTTQAGVPITQAAIAAVDSNGRGTSTIATHLETFPLAYYTIDANTALVIETDGVRVLLGTINRQF